MEDKDLKMILQLREWTMEQYGKLPPNTPSAQVTRKEYADTLETVIRSIDDIVREHVNFS